MTHAFKRIAAAAVLAIASHGAHATTFDGLDVSLVGAATIPTSGDNAGNLLLTPSVIGAVGAAWLSAPVSTASAFSTTFSFKLSNVGGLGNADGVALVFHNSGTTALGSGGGFIGADVPDNTTPGGAVIAGLQTFWQTYGVVSNTDTGPGPFSNALSINAPGDLSAASLITGTETVSYNPTTGTVSQVIKLSYTLDGQVTSLTRSASASANLSQLFGPTMTVGLTGATGGGTTDQAITSWKVSAVPEPSAYAMVLAGLGVVGAMARRRVRQRSPGQAG